MRAKCQAICWLGRLVLIMIMRVLIMIRRVTVGSPSLGSYLQALRLMLRTGHRCRLRLRFRLRLGGGMGGSVPVATKAQA